MGAKTMANVFLSLAREIADVERQTNGIRQLTEHGMASRLLALYLGRNWYEAKVAFCDDPDEWMHNRSRDEGIGRIIYFSRVIRPADAIFALLNGRVKDGEVLKQRFLTRPTNQCFIEAE